MTRRLPTSLLGGQVTNGVLLPQRAMASVARDRLHPPTGMGLDSRAIRQRMIERLRRQGVSDEAVLQVMAQVPRHLFVESALVAQAYEESALPIGAGQTISSPLVVALSLQALRSQLRGRSCFRRVLEIGTGCGYQTTLLACLAEQVVSVERIEMLHQQARENLLKMARLKLPGLRLQNVRLVWGDGMLGFHALAPFDAIISAACGDDVPKAWLAQLDEHGVVVAPVGDDRRQKLCLVRRDANGQWQREILEEVMFVPLKSGTS